MPGDKSGEEVAGEKAVGASCCLPLYWGLPDFGTQHDEDSPPVLLRHHENHHQESPGHALPGPSIGLLCAGRPAAGPPAGLWGCVSRGLAPGAGDRTAPHKHPSYAGGGWQPAPRLSPLPPAGRPPRQLLAQECTSRAGIRHMPPPPRRRGRQLPAAGCSTPARQGLAEMAAGLLRQPLTRGWDAPASSRTHQGKGARRAAKFHSVKKSRFIKVNTSKASTPGPTSP